MNPFEPTEKAKHTIKEISNLICELDLNDIEALYVTITSLFICAQIVEISPENLQSMLDKAMEIYTKNKDAVKRELEKYAAID